MIVSLLRIESREGMVVEVSVGVIRVLEWGFFVDASESYFLHYERVYFLFPPRPKYLFHVHSTFEMQQRMDKWRVLDSYRRKQKARCLLLELEMEQVRDEVESL